MPLNPRGQTLGDKLNRAFAYVGYGLQMLPPLVLPILPDRSAAHEMRIGDRTIRYYRHWPACPQFLQEWDALAIRTPGSTAFQTPHWQAAIARYADSLGTLRLVTVHRDESLVAVIPLEKYSTGHWHTPGQMTTDYLEPLVHPDGALQTWAAALRAIRTFSRDDIASISFDLVSPDAACRQQLAQLPTSTGFKMVEAEASVSTIIPLADTWDAYLAKLKGHDRKELKRKLRKVEEKGAGQLVTCQTSLSVGHALHEVFTLMQESGGGKGRKAKWLFRPHFKIAAPKLADTGRLIVYQLFLNHRLAAGLIALPCMDRQILWCGAFDRDFAEFSPGIVLFAMVFRDAIARGQRRIDLLRGQYPYKYSFGAVDQPLYRVTLQRT